MEVGLSPGPETPLPGIGRSPRLGTRPHAAGDTEALRQAVHWIDDRPGSHQRQANKLGEC